MNHSFNSAARRDNGLMQEPRYFEEAHGISGISGSYVFPGGKDIFQLVDSGAWPSTDAQMQEMWRGLVALNPCLKELQVDDADPFVVNHAVLGVMSCFPVADIAYYMEMLRDGEMVFLNSNRRSDIARLAAQVRPLLEEEIEWVASPETFRLICDKLRTREAADGLTRPRVCGDYPAKDAEEILGISSLSQDYVFPHRMTGAAFRRAQAVLNMGVLECYDFSDDRIQKISAVPAAEMARLQSTWDGLVAVNRALAKVDVPRDDAFGLIQATTCAARLLNVDDINFLLAETRTHGREPRTSDQAGDPVFLKGVADIAMLDLPYLSDMPDLTLGWVVSAATFVRLKDALVAKNDARARAAKPSGPKL